MANSPAGTYSIIIVNDFAHINGGAAQVALSSAQALAERGHKVTVFAAVPPIMPGLRRKNVNVVCTDQREILTDPNRLSAAARGIWNRRAARKMKRVLSECDAKSTIVHLHGWTKSLSSSVIRTALKLDFPVVCTLHDYFTACPNGGFFNYRRNEICPLTAMSAKCVFTHCDKASYGQKLWRVARHAVQKSRGGIPGKIKNFIAITQFSRKILEPYLPTEATIHDVRNPIFVEQTEPARPEFNAGVVAVGRLTPEKGLFLLAEAAKRAKVSLTLVGDGELRDELAHRYPDVTITGWLERPEVMRQIRKARALVLPSLWYETQGLVVAEAAALGIPAIVPDTCAARDMVKDGHTGLWFTGNDVESLTEKLMQISDKEKAAALGRAAYDSFWAEAPTMDRHITRLEEVYADILNRH